LGKNCAFSLAFEKARLQQLAENSDSDFVLKGRGFKPRRKHRTIIRGFSRWGEL
jgi:hypothetical protein